VKETITIPKGVESGVNLRMSKKGNFSLRGESGDLLIKVTVKPHPTFVRDGADIISEKQITFTQAALGSTIKVDTLWGKHDVKLKPGTMHDEQVIL
jgi:DnaJ-class molecular chaperone